MGTAAKCYCMVMVLFVLFCPLFWGGFGFGPSVEVQNYPPSFLTAGKKKRKFNECEKTRTPAVIEMHVSIHIIVRDLLFQTGIVTAGILE